MAGFYKHINSFLEMGNNDDEVANHMNECFCRRCRESYKSLINVRYGNSVEERNRKENELGDKMIRELPAERRAAEKRVFAITKEMIVNGSLYKEACLDGSGYTQFKSWAVLQPRYALLVNGTEEEQGKFIDHCQLINDCANVYESWDIIVKNLTNESITFLNAKTFSIRQFLRAKTWTWCVEENERAAFRRGKRKRPAPAEKLWTTRDVDQAARHLLSINRLSEADVFQTAQFCQQVQRQCLAIVNRRNHINFAGADSTFDADSTSDQSNLLTP